MMMNRFEFEEEDEKIYRHEIVNGKIKIYEANAYHFHEPSWALMYEFEVDIDDLIKFTK